VVQKEHIVDGEDFSLSAHKNKSQYKFSCKEVKIKICFKFL
jgi:hypothetical protein